MRTTSNGAEWARPRHPMPPRLRPTTLLSKLSVRRLRSIAKWVNSRTSAHTDAPSTKWSVCSVQTSHFRRYVVCIMLNENQLALFENGQGFIAALDQNGGSTPNALKMYGIDPTMYSSELEMFDRIQDERARIITSAVFRSDKILATILFQDTLKRSIDGIPVPTYLWEEKGIVPFLKIDNGLADQENGVQLMREISDLDSTLAGAKAAGIMGTKARSVVHSANAVGVDQIIDQQFALAERVLAADLLPILEPEADIKALDKVEAEVLLKAALLDRLEHLGDRQIAVKISIPTIDGFYSDLMEHPNVARVVALSGGYERPDACARLARNKGLIASFSRALLDGLSVRQSQELFNQVLDASIDAIYRASTT